MRGWAGSVTEMATGLKIFPYEHSIAATGARLFNKIASLSQHWTERPKWPNFCLVYISISEVYELSSLLKAGVNLNTVFSPLYVGLTGISRSRFKQFRNPSLITQFYDLGFFCKFLGIFRRR